MTAAVPPPPPLHLATQLGQWKAIKASLSAETVRRLDGRGNTALGHLFYPLPPWMTSLGHLPKNQNQLPAKFLGPCLKAFLELGADPNALHTAEVWRAPPARPFPLESLVAPILTHAVRCNDFDSVQALLRAGADPKARAPGANSLSALDAASQAGVSDAIITLLQAAGASFTRQPTIVDAARRGDSDGVRAFLAAGVAADAADGGTTAFIAATMRGHIAVVDALLAAGADPTSDLVDKADLFGRVVRDGNAASCRKLLDLGFSPDAGPAGAPIGWAIYRGYVEVVRMLLDAGAQLSWTHLNRPVTAQQMLRSAAVPRDTKDAIGALLGEPPTADDPTRDGVRKLKAAAGTPAFQEALTWLTGHFGRAPAPWKRRKGIFVLYAKTADKIMAAQSELRRRGFRLVANQPVVEGEAAPYLVLPTADPFVALRAVGTNGDNYGLSTDEIIAWMRKLETDHPFELTACGFDFLDARLLSPPTGDAARSLAERMVKFCPDMNDATGNAILSVANELSSTGYFFFWWD